MTPAAIFRTGSAAKEKKAVDKAFAEAFPTFKHTKPETAL